MQISYQTEFCAAYRLYRDEWSPEKNREVYGVCASPNGHGHNYSFTTTVKGAVDPETGMLIDYGILMKIVEDKIVRQVDHLNLNVDIDFLKGVVPTSENLLIAFWPIISAELPEGVEIASLCLQESRDCRCEYFGPNS
ncbi:MAG: 6-carboxytetrahydropterin synthase [Planctomycetota bacterium]|jgi:6-pyruvoyltetrahydropterin/6-carboxytetrahydropterin synthase|nr:6-carboxytetrahydropterin synthase [Planctomycetota bacterium]